MIDLHIHILPGLDDGPQSSAESLAMARHAAADGITAVVATPHVVLGLYDNDRDSIGQALQVFRAELQAHDIHLAVHPGAEYRLDPNLPRLIQAGQILTLGDDGRYLLVEFPTAEIPVYAEQVFFDLALLGITPVLAHPERNGALLHNPDQLLPFVERGLLCQGTAGSFTGQMGSRAQQLAHYYLQRGCYHFISSDAHGVVNRMPELQAVHNIIAAYDAQAAGLLTAVNPERLLQGQAPMSLPPSPNKYKSNHKSFTNRLWNKIAGRKY